MTATQEAPAPVRATARSQAGSPPPRRPPGRLPKGGRPPIYYETVPPQRRLVKSVFQMLAVVLLAFVLNITVLSHIQHAVSQYHLYQQLQDQLSAGTLPVSEGDINDVLLQDGAPVALLDIPEIGVHEVIVEGTSSGTLMSGPGHRRDTVLPGQPGVSIILGRAAAYGGPFSRIQELTPGSQFSVVTGQGKQTFRVIGVRYAGDPTPPLLTSGESRIMLETARGPAYVPTGVAYLDAELIGKAKDRGTRQTTFASLPSSNLALGVDTSTLWALVFALQYLVAVEIALALTTPRVGSRKTWIVFVPLVSIGGLWISTQIVYLLPNLL